MKLMLFKYETEDDGYRHQVQHNVSFGLKISKMSIVSAGSLFHDQAHPLIESGAVGLFVIMQAISLIPHSGSSAHV